MYLFAGLGGPEAVIAIALGSMPFILILIALIDILTSNFRDSNTKLIWVIVVIFVPCLGSILYFIMGRSQKIKDPDKF
jgi:hypothetical protein